MTNKDWNLAWELERRLAMWSYWMIGFQENEVGYPTKSTVADFGVPLTSIPKSKPPFPISNLLAEEINCWINLMGIHRPELKSALTGYYLRRRTTRVEELSREFGIQKHAFKQLLRDARSWLMGSIAKEFNK